MTETNQHVETEEIRLEEILGTLLRGKWVLIIAFLLGASLGFVAFKVLPKQYTVKSRWLVSPSTPLSGMTALASLAGITGSQGLSTSQNPAEQYYADLLYAPIFLDSLTEKKWPGLTDSLTFYQMFQLDSNEWGVMPPPFDRKSTLRRVVVGSLISKAIKFERLAGTFVLEVELTDPLAAVALSKVLLSRLMQFNEEMKQGSAEKEYEFIKGQLQHFEDQLAVAERNLAAFLSANQYLESPSQKMQETRLNRDVSIKSALVLEFRKQLEMARISQSKELSPFTIIENPTPSLVPTSPSRIIYMIAGIFVLEVLSVFGIFAWAWFRKNGKSLLVTIVSTNGRI